MSRYKCDPRWFTLRPRVHAPVERSIHQGEPALYYPKKHSLYCDAGERGGSDEPRLQVFDEENSTSMQRVKDDVSGKL